MKVSTIYSAIAMVSWALMGYAFLAFLVLPYLSGELEWYVYNGDNFTYQNIAGSGGFSYLIRELFADSLRNLVGLALFVKLAEFISLEYYDYTILFLNLLILTASIWNYRRVFELLDAPAYSKFLLLMLINPYIIWSMCGASKEIWGILLFSFFLRYMLEGNMFKYFIVVVFSFVIRDAYAIAGLLFFMLQQILSNKFYYLIGVSLLFPFFIPAGQEAMLLQGQDDKSLGFSIILGTIQSYPLGYVLTFIPKLILSAFSPLSPLRFEMPLWNIIGNLTIASAMLTLLLSSRLLYKLYVRKERCNRVLLNFFFAYALVSATTLFIHHRYLFPLYPILIMLNLTTRRDIARTEHSLLPIRVRHHFGGSSK